MHPLVFLGLAVGIVCGTGSLTGPAHGFGATIYVASYGSDNSGCTRAAPCATINFGLVNTPPGGTLMCLDTLTDLNFQGTVTITHSVTIDCSGINASIGRSGAQGFIINGVGISVTLRGLVINSIDPGTFSGPGPTGINIVAAANVTIQDCLIRGFTSTTGGIGTGILLQPGFGVQINLTVSRTLINSNRFGIVANGANGGNVRGVISDSIISNNTNNGITVTTTGPTVVLALENAKVTGNNFGLVATGSNAGMLVRNSTIVGNATGLFTSGGGVLLSYGNNSVNANSAGETFSGPVGLK